jgi:phosphatidylethanolamine-binding protein (PEBP) family uncharacterized protein
MKFLRIMFDGREIKNEEKLNLQDTQKKPKIRLELQKNKLYTLMMVDPDAPSPTNPYLKYVLHWLVVNTTDTILPFNPPAPPAGSGEHRYYVFLFEQPKNIRIIKTPERHKFNLNNFTNEYGLKPISYAMFRTQRDK